LALQGGDPRSLFELWRTECRASRCRRHLRLTSCHRSRCRLQRQARCRADTGAELLCEDKGLPALWFCIFVSTSNSRHPLVSLVFFNLAERRLRVLAFCSRTHELPSSLVQHIHDFIDRSRGRREQVSYSCSLARFAGRGTIKWSLLCRKAAWDHEAYLDPLHDEGGGRCQAVLQTPHQATLRIIFLPWTRSGPSCL